MCGIAGYLDRSVAAGAARRGAQELLERMILALRHRGPDGFGFHLAPPIGLAHARLSIIDLATGEQPIHNEDRSVWVVFNGEIFNYVELRAELLAQGHVFSTQSDTEVIVHLYEQHGDRFVEYLNGQFAIALWDQRAQRLLLCRDRVGIRPLFYTDGGGTKIRTEEMMATLKQQGKSFLAATDQAVTPAELRTNRFVFLHTDLSHNDVVAKRKTFQQFLETSCLAMRLENPGEVSKLPPRQIETSPKP